MRLVLCILILVLSGCQTIPTVSSDELLDLKEGIEPVIEEYKTYIEFDDTLDDFSKETRVDTAEGVVELIDILIENALIAEKEGVVEESNE